MKKKLALILSIVLALSVAIGVFVITTLADDNAPYAQTKATALWEATKANTNNELATSVKLNSTYTALATGTTADLNLKDVNGNDVTVSYAFKDGIFTLKGNGEVLDGISINSNGALWLVLDNVSVKGVIQNHNGWTARPDYSNYSDASLPGGGNNPPYDMPLIISSPLENNSTTVDEDGVGGMIYGIGSNTIRNHGSMVLLGDVGFDVAYSGEAGDVISVFRYQYENKVQILAPGRDSKIKDTDGNNTHNNAIVNGTYGELVISGDIFGNDVSIEVDDYIQSSAGAIKLIEGADLTVNGFNTNYAIGSTSGTSLSGESRLVVYSNHTTPVRNAISASADSTVYYVAKNANSTYTYTFPVAGNYEYGSQVLKTGAGSKFISSALHVFTRTDKDASAGYVYFVDTDGTAVNLIDDSADAAITTYTTLNNGTISYNANTQHVLLNGVAANCVRFYMTKDYTVEVKGENTVNASAANAFWANDAGKMTLTGATAADKLTVTSSANYAVGSQHSDFIIDGNLTLNITAADNSIHASGSKAIIIKGNAQVTVAATSKYAIRTVGNVTIEGSASVTASAQNTTIYTGKDLTIRDTAKVVTSTAKAANSTGGHYNPIHSEGNVIIEGNPIVEAVASSEQAILVNGGDYIQKGGTVTATIYSTAACNGKGIRTSADMTISGGTLTVLDQSSSTSDNTNEKAGIVVGGAYTQTAGDVSIKVPNAPASSTKGTARPAMIVNGAMKVSGGKLTANAVTYGITSETSIEISGTAVVDITTTNAAWSQPALYVGTRDTSLTATGTITVSGGSLNINTTTLGNVVLADQIAISGGNVNVPSVGNGVIYGLNGLVVSGGNVTVTGKDNVLQGRGTHGIVISGGVVNTTATATNAVRGNTITVSGGELNAEASGNYGVYTEGGALNLIGGTVNVDVNGNACAIYSNGGAFNIGGADTSVTVNVNSKAKENTLSLWAINGWGSAITIGKNATVNVWAGYAAIHAKSGGDLIIQDNAVVNAWANKRGTVQSNGGNRGAALMADGASIYIKGGTVNAESAGEETVAAFANSNYANSGIIEISGGTLNAKTTELGKTIHATTINFKGGEVTAVSNSVRAINATNLNVSGGSVKAYAPTADYNGVAVVSNYKQTGGNLELYIDGCALTTGTAVGLHFNSATGASFEGGTLHIAEINSASDKNTATYAIWSNSTDLNFSGTDVSVDLTGNNQKSWANCAVKVQGGKAINVSGGSIDVRGGTQIDVFRLDDDGCAVNLTGGAVTGATGRLLSIHPGDGKAASINVTANAKIDLYYLTEVARASTGTLNATGVDANIWMKNCAWTSGTKWLTTSNWNKEGTVNPAATQVKLNTNSGIFYLDLNGVRQFPASASNPIFVLSADGALLQLQGNSVAAGQIYAIEANGNLTIDVPAGETLELGTKDHNYNINSMNGLTIKGNVKVATKNNGITARGDINFVDADVTVEVLADGGSNPIQATGSIVIENSKITSISKGHTAMRADGTVTIVDSEVTVSNPQHETLLGNNGITITGSTVTATAGNYSAIATRGGSIVITNSTVNATGANDTAIYTSGSGNITISNSKVTAITTLASNTNADACPRVIYAAGGDFTLEGDDSVLVVKSLATTSNKYGPRAIEAGKNLYFNGGKLYVNCDEGSTVTVNADGTITTNLINPSNTASMFAVKVGGTSYTMNFNGTDAVIAAKEQAIHSQGGAVNFNAGTVSVVTKGYGAIRNQGAGNVSFNGGTVNLVSTSPAIQHMSTGAVVVNGGTLNINANRAIDANTLEIKSGTANFNTTSNGANVSNYKQSGGTLNFTSSGDAFNVSAANIAFNISGGNLNVKGGSCGIRLNATTKAEFNVSGGNVNITGLGQVLYLNGSATNNVNLTGGTTTITHDTQNDYRPIQLNGTGTVSVSGNAKLYALGNGFHSIQATNLKVSGNAYVKATTRDAAGGAYFAVKVTNMTVEGGTVELFAGSTAVAQATNYTQTAGDVSFSTYAGRWSTGLRSMNANITGGSMKFACVSDAFEASSGNEAATHNGTVNIGGTAKITGYAARFFDGNADAKLNISGTPTIDFYNSDGTSVRSGESKIDTGDVQFVAKCRPQDKTFFITTGNAVNGNAPSQIVVVGTDGTVNFLHNEDGKRTYGGATRTGEKTVTFEGLNAQAVRANGELNVTVKGANNVLNTTANYAITTLGGDLNFTGTASDVLSVTGNQYAIHSYQAINATGLKLIAKGNAGYAINPVGTGTFTNANLVVGCNDGSTFTSINGGIDKDYIIQANGGLIFKNTKLLVYGTSNLLHSNSHDVGIQILEGSKIDAVCGNTRALRAQHGDLVVSGAGTVVNVKIVAATWGQSCVHVQGQTDVSDFIISDGAVVNMENNGAANNGIVAIDKGSLILDNGQLLLNNKGSSPTAKSNKLGLIHVPAGKVSITNDSYLEMKGSGHTSANIVASGDMVVEDSKVKIEQTHDDVLRITGKLVIKNSDAEIFGGYNNAVYAGNTIEITDSIVNVNAYKGYAMQATKGISVVDSSLYINTKRTSTIDNIVPDVTLDTANSYCVQTNGNLLLDGSTVIAYGYSQVLHMNNASGAISFLNGTKAALKAEDQYAVRAQAGNIVVTDSTVMAEALYNTLYTQVGKIIVNSGFVSAQTNATEADLKAAQDTYNAIANPTWADANTKKSRVRNFGSNLIRGDGGVEINGGTVIIGTENGMGNECAIYSAGNFKMTGGTVKAYVMYNRNQYGWQTDNESVFNQGPASRDKSNLTGCYGIRIKGNIDITGGDLTVGARTMGIYSDTGYINIGGDAKVNVKVSENAGIRGIANTNITIDCAELTVNARNDAIVKEGSNKNSKIDILGGKIVLNADYEAIDISGGVLTFGGDADLTANVKDGYGIYAQYNASKVVIKENAKVNINLTAIKSTWRAALAAFNLEMLGGDVNIDIDCAPFAKYDQRILTAINVQGTDVYNLGVMNLKKGNIKIDVDNNYNDANYTTKVDGTDTKEPNADRNYIFFFKNVSAANFDGTNVESDLHTLMPAGNSGHIAVQGTDTVINVNAGKLAFNSTGDVTSVFVHTINAGKINLNGGEITGSANYFWHACGGMNKVMTVKPEMKIDFYNYSGDAVNLGTYNANNQTYHNWFVDEGVEYLPGCSLKNNTQFLTTANMTTDGDATQVEIKVNEGSALKTYALSVIANDPDNASAVPNRAYPAGAGPVEAKAYLLANGELIINDLSAQSLAFNGDILVDLNGTSTLVKNGTHTIYGSGDVTFGGDGVLEMSGTDYVIYALGNEINFTDKAQVKVIATKGNGIHLNSFEATTSVNILDEANLVVEATENFSVDKDGKVTYSNNGRGIYIRGIDTSVNVGDNAVLDITSTDQGIYVLSNNGAEGDVTKATVNIGDNAKVDIKADAAIVTNAIVSTANVNGNAVVNMPEVSKSFYVTGADATVNIGGNAQILVDKSVGDGLTIQSNVVAPEGVKQNASITVSGKANYVITDAASCGARIAITATDAYKEAVPGTTAFIVSDEANVEMNSAGQTVYLLSNVTGGSAKFAITDKATATLVNDSPTSQYGAAVQINSPSNDIDITTSGMVNVHGKAATWQGAFFVTGGTVSTDVLIKDATLNVTNIQATDFEILDANKKNTFAGEISNAMMISGKGKVEITGDAVVNAYAERNGTKYNNRAHGLFISEDMSLVISGNADATFAAGGDSKANTGAGIHLKQSDITVTDNATLRANASGNAVAGITFEGASSLTVNKYGVALIDGGKDAAGVRGYNKSADVDIIVKDGGHAQFTGKPALDLKAGTFEYSVSKVIAGKDKASSKETAITVVQREYKDLGYVVLKGQMRNPSTSDYVITYVVVAAILAVAAAAAVIVIRKKKSQD